jgi:MFS family permease
MQIPSNMFLNYIGKPSLYLPACMVIWGIISALTGITAKYECIIGVRQTSDHNSHISVTGVLLTRFFLGFVEAAFFPGAVFLISKWFVDYRVCYQRTPLNPISRYKRDEIGLRLTILSWYGFHFCWWTRISIKRDIAAETSSAVPSALSLHQVFSMI